MVILKAPLNAVFMYDWFGFEALGGAGGALSSTILTWLSFFVYIYVWKKDSFYELMRCSRFYGPDPRAMWAQLKIGIPIGLSTFFEVSSFTLMAIFISRFGAVTVSAHQIVANITSMCYMIAFSIGISCTVLVSQCLGGGLGKRSRKSHKEMSFDCSEHRHIGGFNALFWTRLFAFSLHK